MPLLPKKKLLKERNGMYLIKEIGSFDKSIINGRPYDIEGYRNALEQSGDKSFLNILMYNVIEILNEYKLMEFKSTYTNETFENNTRIKEISLFIRHIVGMQELFVDVHSVIDLDATSADILLDKIISHDLSISSMRVSDDGIILSNDGRITIPLINEFIRQFNESIIHIIETLPSTRISEDTITQTLMHHLGDMIDAELMEMVVSDTWAVVKNHTRFDEYDILFDIKEYLSDKKMKFIPNLGKSCFIINDDLDITQLKKIFPSGVCKANSITDIPVKHQCAILFMFIRQTVKDTVICTVDNYRQLLKFNLQFGDSGFNSGKYVVLLNYELAKSLTQES